MASLCPNFESLLLILCISLTALWCNAQEKLVVGDAVPNTAFTVYQNGESRKTDFSEFKGKLVIIDFWATWCSSCIKKFPELEALQAQFKNRLQVILVSEESETKINAFLEKRKNLNQPSINLPMVMTDTHLASLFPHQLLPHEVWINSDRKVYAITGADEVTATNIEKALAKENLSAQSKVDIDAGRPLFSVSELPLSGLQNYSLLLKGYYPGLPSGTRYRKAEAVTYGIGISNFKLSDLFFAVGRQLKPGLLKKQLVLPENDKNLQEFFTFEFCLPKSQAPELASQMLKTLNRYSGYQGVMKTEMRPCLILRKIADKSTAVDTSTAYENSVDSRQHLKMRNAKVISLVNRLNDLEEQKLLVLDESNISIPVSLDLDLKGDLDAQLRSYGLCLEKAVRSVNMFYITKI